MSEIIQAEQQDTADYDTAKKVAEMLNKHYPGHLWGVSADQRTGICIIKDMYLSGDWGFVLHLTTIYADPSLRAVIRAGGELLERYKLSRGMFSAAEYDDLQTDFAGRFILEH